MLLALSALPMGAAYAGNVTSPTAVQNVQAEEECKGVVLDATGEPMIGASVVVKGKSGLGTVTDIDGNFTLRNVKKGETLRITSIGMTPVEVVYKGGVVNVTLKDDSQALNEVVVTALGMKRETKALGYAVTELKGDDLSRANTISPVSSLQGKVAGVDIAASDGGIFGATKIQIRGASTLKGNNQPIYVIDGVILDNNVSGSDDLNWTANPSDYGNELKNLNPDDFEAVSVLKGAAATALYGSRALNGAVVITTKSGKEYSVATLAGNNALVMKVANQEMTLELANPEKLEEVYVLAISANGSSDFDAYAVYDDASTSATSTFSPADWFGSYESGKEAQYGLSRIIRSAADTYSADDIDNRYNFRTYEYTMELDRTKMTKALTFKSKVNGAYPTILAVSKKGYKEPASGIENLTTGNGAQTVVGIYSLDGMKLNSLRKGINIIKMSDGSVKKVLVRK